MNSKAMTLSLIMAGIAVFFVMSSVNSIKEESRTRYGKDVTVIVAKEDIREMDTIHEKMMEPKVVPITFVEPTAIRFTGTGIEESSDVFQSEIRRIVGNIALVSIKKGEQLTLNKIAETSMRTGLSPQISRGRRAFSIPADDVSAVTRLLRPGDRVDVISIVDVGAASGRDNKVARTLFQDLVVLAVGRNITNNFARRVDFDPSTGRERVRNLTEYDGYSTVTIEVEPFQAQQLAAILAGSGNRIMLSLRNNDDTDRTALAPTRAGDTVNDGIRTPAASPAQGEK